MKIIPMSAKEVKKLEAVETVRSGRLTQKEAAERLKVTDRCLRYWLDAFETDGAAGLVHGGRGSGSPGGHRRQDAAGDCVGGSPGTKGAAVRDLADGGFSGLAWADGSQQTGGNDGC